MTFFYSTSAQAWYEDDDEGDFIWIEKTETFPLTKNWAAILDYQYSHWEVKPRTYLLSHPRSGNTWMRYALEFLTKRPTTFSLDEVDFSIPEMDNPIGVVFPDLGVDPSKPSIIKMHNLGSLANHHPEDKLILVVRNYKESLMRRFSNITTVFHQITLNEHLSYFTNLRDYDRWDPKRRMLIYYEDFLLYPRETLSKLLEFLKEDSSRLDLFFQDFEFHRQRALAYYDQFQAPIDFPSLSRGEDPTYHTKKLTTRQRMRFDMIVQKKYSYLFEMYLSRYAEN